MTTKWALATEKNSSLKTTKTTYKFYFPIPIITVALPSLFPKETQPILSQNPARRRRCHWSRLRRFTSDDDASARSQLRRFRRRRCFSSLPIMKIQTSTMLQLTPNSDDSIAGNASSFATSDRDASTLIAMLQLSITGDASSFATSDNAFGDASIHDAFRFFFFFFWSYFFVNFDRKCRCFVWISLFLLLILILFLVSLLETSWFPLVQCLIGLKWAPFCAVIVIC